MGSNPSYNSYFCLSTFFQELVWKKDGDIIRGSKCDNPLNNLGKCKKIKLDFHVISFNSFYCFFLYPGIWSMKGYIVFVFSVNVCVCVCVHACELLFFVKDFSGTTTPRILKFGTNVGYDKLYCIKENQPPPAYHSLYLSIFLSLQSDFLS